jgi:hypothetical protein
MKIKLSELRQIIREVLEDDVEERIEELQEESEFKDIGSFIEMKLENDEYEYGFVELQALARNMMAAMQGGRASSYSSPSAVIVDRIKRELRDMGFKFVGREPLKKTRGFTSPMHGSNRFAGMAGGSGMGSSFDGPSGFGIGGGPGAIGGGYEWKAGDSKNLSMGSRRR